MERYPRLEGARKREGSDRFAWDAEVRSTIRQGRVTRRRGCVDRCCGGRRDLGRTTEPAGPASTSATWMEMSRPRDTQSLRELVGRGLVRSGSLFAPRASTAVHARFDFTKEICSCRQLRAKQQRRTPPSSPAPDEAKERAFPKKAKFLERSSAPGADPVPTARDGQPWTRPSQPSRCGCALAAGERAALEHSRTQRHPVPQGSANSDGRPDRSLPWPRICGLARAHHRSASSARDPEKGWRSGPSGPRRADRTPGDCQAPRAEE